MCQKAKENGQFIMNCPFVAAVEGFDRMRRLRLAYCSLGDRNSDEFQYPPHAFG